MERGTCSPSVAARCCQCAACIDGCLEDYWAERWWLNAANRSIDAWLEWMDYFEENLQPLTACDIMIGTWYTRRGKKFTDKVFVSDRIPEKSLLETARKVQGNSQIKSSPISRKTNTHASQRKNREITIQMRFTRFVVARPCINHSRIRERKREREEKSSWDFSNILHALNTRWHAAASRSCNSPLRIRSRILFWIYGGDTCIGFVLIYIPWIVCFVLCGALM